VLVDEKDFVKEVSRVNKARPSIKTKRKNYWPVLSLSKSRCMSIDLDILLRSRRRGRKTDSTFIIDEEKRGFLLGVAK
jgi:hypothetical protein